MTNNTSTDTKVRIRHVVEAHDSLCLDVRAERERLIKALMRALTNSSKSV